MMPGPVTTLRILWCACALLAIGGCDMFVSAEERTQRAEQMLEKGDYRGAMAELKTVLQKEPDNAAARLALARLSLWLGDDATAEKELERAQSGADPAQFHELQYRLLLAQEKYDELENLLKDDTTLSPVRRAVLESRIAIGRGDREAARLAANRALAVAPDDPEAQLDAARIEVLDGNAAPALSLPERVAGTPDIQARAFFLRAAVQMNQGAFADARKSLTEAATLGRHLPLPDQFAIAATRVESDLADSDVAAAEKNVARLTTLAPDTVVTHYLRARVAMAKNDFVAAVAECQRALRIEPQHVQSQLLLASAHLSQGSLEQAQDTLTRLLAARPDTPAARKLLAQVYLGRDKPAEARRILSDAGVARDADTEWLMGTALLRSGEDEAGIARLEASASAAPDDMRKRVELASAYISARMPEKAVALLETVPDDSPVAGSAKALLVLASTAGKPRPEARREVEELARKHADDPDLLTVAGVFLAGIGESGAGAKVLESAIQIEPSSVKGRLGLARIYAAQGRIPQADALLKEVMKLDPRNQFARVGLSQIAWSQGDRAEAVKILEDAIAADPATIDARLRLAQLMFVQGDGARARGLLQQVLEVAPDRRSALITTGQVLAGAGLTDEALVHLKEASAAGDARATLAIARVYLGLGDLKNAGDWARKAANGTSQREAEQMLVAIDAREGNVDRAFDRARKLAGDTSPGTLAAVKGDLLMLAGRKNEGIASYESAQRQQPSAQVALKLYSARREANIPEPERVLREWLQRSPTDIDVHRVLVAYYEQTGNRERAIAEYERFAASGAVDPVSLNNLAWTLHERGDARAITVARRAYEAAPEYPEIADTYGWILVRTDKVADGLNVLKEALINAPDNPDIQYHLAYAYAKSGEKAQAAELLRKALVSESFMSRADAEKLLQSLNGSGG